MTRAYLDYNATSPRIEAVFEAMLDAGRRVWANPSSVHGEGREARALLEESRESIARVVGLEARGVVFTSGGTEANNWALADARHIVTSRLEHPSVTRAAEAAARRGAAVTWLPLDATGRVDPASLERTLKSLGVPALVAVMAVSHETGVVQPIPELARVAREAGATLHVDAVQWLGKGDPEWFALADSVSVASHKLGGPKGIGALLLRRSPPVRLLFGGAQERGHRPGTQDPVLAFGFARALEHAERVRPQRGRLESLRDHLEEGVRGSAQRNGTAPRLPHVANLSFAGHSGPELVAALDLLGVAVSSGSACSAGTLEPSEAISAMSGLERARCAVRFSLGEFTSRADIDACLLALSKLLAV